MNMKTFLYLITFFILTSSYGADFEKITVENLDLEYKAPYGSGTVDRVGIGLGLAPENYVIAINRTEDAFELTSPYVDFTWRNPVKFIFDLEALTTRKTNAALGTKTHFIDSEFVMIKPEGRGEYKAELIKGLCEGKARGSFEMRLLEDCRNKLDLTIRRIDVPTDFILYKLLEDLPPLPGSDEDVPGDYVIAKINNGDLFLQVYIKYVFYAGLRTWGHVRFEDDHKTLAIRVDQIKFGYLTVTKLVMSKLKEIIKNPDVKVDPPWIRINIGSLNEKR
jgi:hypothetical protein